MGRAQFLLHPAAFRDVTEQNGQVFPAGIGVHFHHAIRDRRWGFEMDRLPALQGMAVSGLECGAAGGRKDLKELPPEHLVARLSEMAKGRVVDVGEAPLPVDGEKAVGDAVHDHREPLLGIAELFLGLLEVRDVDEGDDHPLDAVVLGPVGHDAADVPAAVVGLHLPGERGQIDEHPAGIVQKRLVGEAHQDVPDRPAQVGGDQAHQAGDRRREALDPELLVEEQGGDARAGQEVHHIVVGAFQLVDLLLEADVDGVELLVEGLELLLGGLHLLVCGLELFVGRHDLLVGGLELVVGALQLVDGALQLLAGDLQLVRQLTDIPVRRALPARFPAAGMR